VRGMEVYLTASAFNDSRRLSEDSIARFQVFYISPDFIAGVV